ncbi:hypothetical protein [Colwellia sp. Bg11-28]|uniref:hypothetical protein n=1 Tax=Colwellia sp. Bg11-28 TaxID=2058305 RepID=UPI000C34AB1A|nr:hypothetical protein [Colwellia sp. Bg11-28]PKH87176.1 hypothetical protein CXF79_10820 [Colwellia sp. Bg11-28]
MCNKNKYLLTVCLSLISGCSSSSSFQSNAKVPETNYSQNNSNECIKIDPVNTSLLTLGVTGLATLNPIAALIVGGATYFTVDSGVFDCNKSD